MPTRWLARHGVDCGQERCSPYSCSAKARIECRDRSTRDVGAPRRDDCSIPGQQSRDVEPSQDIRISSGLKPGAEAAATALVSSWASGDRAAALTVATPSAVSTLFSNPYSSGNAIDRGCSTSFSPIVCTFGPPGGASPTDPIFEIDVTQTAGGWYVSSVKKQN